MKVLLSIKPEYAHKIFEGSKKYEFRRNIFKRESVVSVVVYASAPICKVIGEFEIEEILHEELESLWEKTKRYAGISKARFLEYFARKEAGYAIEVRNSVLYEEAMQLAALNIQAAPQSFLYLRGDNNPMNMPLLDAVCS